MPSAFTLRAAEAEAVETRENNTVKVEHLALCHQGIAAKGSPAQALWVGSPMCKNQLSSFILPLYAPYYLCSNPVLHFSSTSTIVCHHINPIHKNFSILFTGYMTYSQKSNTAVNAWWFLKDVNYVCKQSNKNEQQLKKAN